jgi:3-phenylpropionate/trans-cinnamate dioxygenase ferredoxin reductase component
VTETGFVIVGGGLAGAKAAEALREQGYQGPLTLVGDEEHLPYERPPLSKGYLAGSDSRESFVVHDAGWYDDRDVTLLLGKAATAVDAVAHEVSLVDGTTLSYAKLMLATGSRARRLPIPGAGAVGVHTLRTVDDSERISAAIAAGGRLAIVGGGWIGMEIAANARQRGAEVTVVEAAAVPLGAALGPELAQVFLDLHREHGVTFHLNATVAELTTNESAVTGVRLGDGTLIEADAVVVGVGAQPNLELAESAGLALDNGVLVDEALQSSDPDIVAVGDIANHLHPVLGQRVRVEHWANALNQPAAAAATMRGVATPYTELPYFFTDQYDLGMEYVGHAPPGSYARVVTRGDVGSREFIAFWLDGSDRVLAGMNVNIWDVVDGLKALILSRGPVDLDRLANPALVLTDSLRG